MHEIFAESFDFKIRGNFLGGLQSDVEQDKSQHTRIDLCNCGSNFIFRRASNETQNITFAAIHGNDGRLPKDQKSIWQSLSNFAYKNIYIVGKKHHISMKRLI